MGIIWICSIVATVVIAVQKKFNLAGYFLLSLFLGPFAVLIVALVPSREKATDKTPSLYSLEDARVHLKEIKDSLDSLGHKTAALEEAINKLAGQEIFAPKAEASREDAVAEPEKGIFKQEMIENVPEKTSDMESDFGRYWLNKIGIAVFTLGIGFLISYTFKYFGPFLKIALGYVLSLVLFFLGLKLEAKERLVRFGRVLLGGAWALVYFTTYAMHHFEASRIIQSPLLDVYLLALVVAGMMAHVLRYKSEGMMSVTLFVAYITATMGQVTGFTFVSCLLLSGVVLVLVYKLEWIKTLVVGILLTYGIHHIWVAPNIAVTLRETNLLGITTPDYHYLLNFFFLTAYAVVFLAGIHIAKPIKNPELQNAFAATNFGNFALYSILAYPLMVRLFYAQRFLIILAVGIIYLGLALLMKCCERKNLYVSDVVAAVLAITFAIPLKFSSTPTLLVWLAEIPCLLFAGLYFKEKVYRYLSYGLTVLVSFRMMLLSSWGEGLPDVYFLGLCWTGMEFMLLWAAVSMAVCFYLTHQSQRESALDPTEETADHVFSGLACFCLTTLMCSRIVRPWLTFGLAVESLAVFWLADLLRLKRFRVYGYVLLAILLGLFVSDKIFASTIFVKGLIISADILVFFAIYFFMKYLEAVKRFEPLYDQEKYAPFWGGVFVLSVTIFQYVPDPWISLALGMAGVAAIFMGIVNKDKVERLGGLILFALTLLRVIFIDLAQLAVIFKIVSFIILGAMFLGVSYLYNRWNIGQEKDKG